MPLLEEVAHAMIQSFSHPSVSVIQDAIYPIVEFAAYPNTYPTHYNILVQWVLETLVKREIFTDKDEVGRSNRLGPI